MSYKPLEAPTGEAIEKWLMWEIRRLTQMVYLAKAKDDLEPEERAMIGIMLGEKFGYQSLLRAIRKTRNGRKAKR